MAPCAREAGHAVIAHSLGVPVMGMTTDPNGSGACHIGRSEPQVGVLIAVAGYFSELRYCELVGGCPANRHPNLSKSDDDQRAWAAAQEAFPLDVAGASRFLAETRATVPATVIEYWSHIERVALGMFQSPNGILKSQPLRSLLDGAGDEGCEHTGR